MIPNNNKNNLTDDAINYVKDKGTKLAANLNLKATYGINQLRKIQDSPEALTGLGALAYNKFKNRNKTY